jgi:hypothetical protein
MRKILPIGYLPLRIDLLSSIDEVSFPQANQNKNTLKLENSEVP